MCVEVKKHRLGVRNAGNSLLAWDNGAMESLLTGLLVMFYGDEGICVLAG